MTAVFEDAFNLLCGEKIGSGVHRDVFECRIDQSLVVKVETDAPWRYFANVMEMKLWSDHQDCEKIAKWLAPCEYMSPDGLILLQKKAEAIRSTDELPEMVPTFLTDIKRENYGWFEGRIVCVDYAINISNPSSRLKKTDWE